MALAVELSLDHLFYSIDLYIHFSYCFLEGGGFFVLPMNARFFKTVISLFKNLCIWVPMDTRKGCQIPQNCGFRHL